MPPLTKAGCKTVFRVSASGAETGCNQLHTGDVLMTPMLDRLAQSERDQAMSAHHQCWVLAGQQRVADRHESF
jgi:hypothetical protein